MIAFHILDPIERSFELSASDATIVDMESGEIMRTQPYQLQKSYQQAVADYVEGLKSALLSENIDYLLLDTTTSFDHALAEYLHKRERMG